MRMFVISLLCVINGVTAQTYLWPTSVEPFLSSSFCEFRPGHYHSGIDIKTWNREGYPCYAIDDGYIERIRVSPFGYGKVVYLRLRDGHIAVYGHLQRFTANIDRTVRSIQLKNRQYQLTWHPKNLPVKRGEIIGYTGRTGIGTPHLHFEIRNENDQPLNPLAYYDQVKDTIRPKLQQLAVLPLAAGSRINDSLLPQVFDLVYINHGRYKIEKPIHALGKIGLAIKGYDQANGVPNTFAFYQTKMSLEDQQVFQITYDRLDFAETAYLDAEIHHPFWANQKKVFHKLYIDPYNRLSAYNRDAGTDGSVTINDKSRKFTIEVIDYHGNLSVIEGVLLPLVTDLQQVTYIQRQQDWVYVKLSTLNFDALDFFAGDHGLTWIPIQTYEIMGRYSENPGETLLMKFQVIDSLFSHLKVVSPNQAVSIPLRESTEILRADMDFLGKQLILSFGNPAAGLHLIGRQPNGFNKISRIISDINQVYLAAHEINTGSLQLDVLSDRDTLWENSLEIARLLPQVGQQFSWFDSSLILETRKYTVFDTTLIAVRCVMKDSLTLNTPLYGDIFEIIPDDMVLLDNAILKIKAEFLPEANHWGVFSLVSDQLSFISDNYASGYFTLDTKSFGKYIIASDTLPPELNVRSPESNKTYRINPDIDFSVADILSGVDGTNGIALAVDTLFVLPEWDPEDDLVKAVIDAPLPSGRHTLYIEVKDFLHNTARDTVHFFIQ